MTESILDSTKKVLGIAVDYTAFDDQIVLFINTAFSNLNQLGVGPETGFHIEDKTPTWDDFLTDGDETQNNVKSYVYLSVRLVFDPPQTAYLVQAFEAQLEELGWRINVRREEKKHPWPTAPPIVMGRSWLAPVENEVNWG